MTDDTPVDFLDEEIQEEDRLSGHPPKEFIELLKIENTQHSTDRKVGLLFAFVDSRLRASVRMLFNLMQKNHKDIYPAILAAMLFATYGQRRHFVKERKALRNLFDEFNYDKSLLGPWAY